MKRFLLFYGDTYYPLGGMKDFRGSFDSVDAAKFELIGICPDWAHIWDTQLDTAICFARRNTDHKLIEVPLDWW